ncbi:cytochrome P450 [Amycolatopsis sp. NPDC021455]|uniref:cytochrome P450 n=1 Tax=Amycolatopsis sp. NPDC021455 TaxID=3154901 RepID=UPI0033D2D742
MTFTDLKTVADLPAMADFVDGDDWSRDIRETARQLAHRAGKGLLRGPENIIIVSRNHDARELAANPDLGNMPTEILLAVATARDVATPTASDLAGFEQFLRNQIFTANPPLHQPSRKTVARQLMPRGIQRFIPAAQHLAQELVDDATSRGKIDFVRDFAGPFVARFWAGQLGMSADQAAHVHELTDEMSLTFLLARTPEQTRRLYSAVSTYMDVVGTAVRRAWEAGDNELLTAMAADLAEIDVEGKPEDIGRLVASNFFDGFHTVGMAIANVAFRLLSDEAAHAQVRADPSLVTNAFYEGTRLEPPLILTQRLTLRDVVHDGVLIPAGSPVGMVWAAANRDPEVFPDADSYRLTRPIQHGTTFGGGAHLCPGRNVARMLTEVAITALTAPGVDVALVGEEPDWVPHSIVRQLRALPVTIRRADPR